jgi:hypothetical protein
VYGHAEVASLYDTVINSPELNPSLKSSFILTEPVNEEFITIPGFFEDNGYSSLGGGTEVFCNLVERFFLETVFSVVK